MIRGWSSRYFYHLGQRFHWFSSSLTPSNYPSTVTFHQSVIVHQQGHYDNTGSEQIGQRVIFLCCNQLMWLDPKCSDKHAACSLVKSFDHGRFVKLSLSLLLRCESTNSNGAKDSGKVTAACGERWLFFFSPSA